MTYLVSETNAEAQQDTSEDEHGNIGRPTVDGSACKKGAATYDDGIFAANCCCDSASYEWRC